MKFDFPNKDGEVLSGRLEMPERTPRSFALFVHCFTCSKDVIAANVVSKTLTEAGFGVLRFDFTGLGNSQGDFANTNFSSNIEDMLSASAHLGKEYSEPELLIGHSLGGAAVLKAASLIDSVRAVVTINAPSDTNHVAKLFQTDIAAIEKQGKAEVQLAGRSFTITKQLIDNLQETKILQGVKDLHKALLILHAPFDKSVSIDHASKIFAAAKHPKSFVSLDSADHLLSNKQDAAYAARVIGAWAQRYVNPLSKANQKVEKKHVVVRSRSKRAYTQDVYTRDHHVVADEPKSAKGDNLGMDPYQYLLASLGACTAMTLRMYADLKKIPLDGVEVTLSHEKIHAEDCRDCQTQKGKIDRIEKIIHLSGDLSDEQKKRLYQIAEKCPVNKTLRSEIAIEQIEPD